MTRPSQWQIWRERLANYLHRDIYQVIGGDQWVLYWVGHYITQRLQERHPVRAYLLYDPWRLRNQVIQFVDRYIYLNGPFQEIHPSNYIFLTWFHGDLTVPDPKMQKIFERLPEALPHLEKIVVSCQTTRQVLLDLNISAEKLVTIPIGIDLDQFAPPAPQERQKARHKFNIPDDAICIGSFQKDGTGWKGEGLEPKYVKGPDVFLDVIEQLAQYYPNLIIFLTGPARGYVKQGLEKIGVPYIHHHFENYHDIAECYHALDLYIITSRCEGGPKALMESWATGVPLVSTRVGMPADLIRHNKNAMLAEIEDVTGLVEYARTLLEDKPLQEQCRQQGFEDVKLLDWRHVADQYYDMYKPFLR